MLPLGSILGVGWGGGRSTQKVNDALTTCIHLLGAHDGCERPFTDTSSPGHVIFPDDLEDIIEIHLDRDKDWQYATDIVDIGAMERPENPPDLIGEVIHQAGHVLQFVHSTNEQSFMHRPLPAKDMKYAPHYILDHEDKKVVKTSLGIVFLYGIIFVVMC